MAIDKNLLHFKTKESFLSKIENNINTPTFGSEEEGNTEYGQIKGESIVFIKDSNEIWTHGNLYKCVKWGEITVPEGDVIMTIDDKNSNPKIPTVGDSSWIKGRRCLAKNISDGVAICYLDENDSSKFHNGTDAALDGSMGEFMVDLPENYVTATDFGEGLTGVTVSKNSGTTTFRRVLLGVVHGIIDDAGVMHSIVDGVTKPTTSKNIFQFHNAAIANGVGWDIMDYETRNKVTILAYAKHGNRNLQAVYGLGDLSDFFVEGDTISLGNKENIDPNGGVYSTLGIENYFNNVYDFIGGIHKEVYTDPEGSTKVRFYIYDGLSDQMIPDVEYRIVEGLFSVNGYISKMMWGEYADLIPTEAHGGTTTYYTDWGFFMGSNDYPFVKVGGSGYNFTDGGANFNANYGASETSSIWGARLQYRGNITIIEDPEEFKLL